MKISRSEIFYSALILTYSNILCNYANPTIRQKSACRICEIRQPILKFVGFGRHSDSGSIISADSRFSGRNVGIPTRRPYGSNRP